MIVTRKDTADTLRRAADLLEQHGWIQNAAVVDPDGNSIHPAQWRPGCRACMVGAIHAATPNSHSIRLAAVDAVSLDIRDYPADWNDNPDRTAGEVIAQMRKTANRLDPQGDNR